MYAIDWRAGKKYSLKKCSLNRQMAVRSVQSLS